VSQHLRTHGPATDELGPAALATKDRTYACHNCGAQTVSVFHEVADVPVNSCLMLPSREAALAYPKGQIRLGFCRSCGFIENVLFDPSALEYSSSYEETQGCSPRFRAFACGLASQLVERHDLKGKTIIEIGCGKGEFLALLCELGDNRGIGIDPSFVSGRVDGDAASRMTFITDFYGEKYSHLTADLVCCRHTLEHIQPTKGFLDLVRRSIGNRPDTRVFFEVPDVGRVLREVAFWDIYYEHCSYFSLGSLARLFRSSGFEILDLAKGFDDQYLLITARPGTEARDAAERADDDLQALARDIEHFAEHYSSTIERWEDELTQIKSRGQRCVLWGSGSKAVAYLNTLRIRDEVQYVVDINPVKHGMYLAGMGQRIVPPDFLKQYRPDVVIAMNPIYRDEIRRDLDMMGVGAKLLHV
jgi:SAM-dependent methyltransferase